MDELALADAVGTVGACLAGLAVAQAAPWPLLFRPLPVPRSAVGDRTLLPLLLLFALPALVAEEELVEYGDVIVTLIEITPELASAAAPPPSATSAE